MERAFNLVLGFVLGSLVGSATVLLLTPMSGDELRMEIRDYTRHVKSEVEYAANAKRAELERDLEAKRTNKVPDL